MAGDSGLTRLTVVRTRHAQLSPSERLLKEVRTSLGGQFEVFGELGRAVEGKVVYLARELSSGHLVALQLVPDRAGSGGNEDYWVEVLRKLDASVPAVPGNCPRCGNQLRGWVRYCSQCGADLSGIAPAGGAKSSSADDLLRAVRDSARGRYEVLGQMPHAEGGGIVYFAREVGSGKVVALRLLKEYDTKQGTEQYSIGVTRVLTALAESLDPRVENERVERERAERERAAQSAPTIVRPPTTATTSASSELGGDDKPPSTLMPASATASSTTSSPPTMPAPSTGEWSYRSMWRPLALVGGVLIAAVVLWALTRDRQTEGVVAADSTVADTAAGTVLPAADSGAVRIGADLPPGAVVTVDGQRTRTRMIRLGPGSHTFRISAPGFHTTIQSIEVGAGESIIWTPQLVRIPANPTGREKTNRPSGGSPPK